MDRIVRGYGAKKANSKLLHQSNQIKKIAPKEVVVEISHCGICYSEIHLIDNDWGISNYPFIPGHEIVGVIIQKGSQVKTLKLGQRVVLGWFSQVCGKCTYCKTDIDNMCASPEMTTFGRNGVFADYVKADKSVIYPIPERFTSEHDTPLM